MASEVMLAPRSAPKTSCDMDIDDVRDVFRNASVTTIYVSPHHFAYLPLNI